MLKFIAHYGTHFLIPLAVALMYYNKIWKKAFIIMAAFILIDIDHLFANPIFDPNRCSIGFHPLHSYYIIPFYIALVFPKRTRLIGLGLVIHILADVIDCSLM